MARTRYRPEMTYTAERRAEEAQRASTPAARKQEKTGKEDIPEHAALTRRERKVKQILLQELRRMSDWDKLSYAEIQHLDKTLDVEFIDEELAKMRKWARWLWRYSTGGAVLTVGCVIFSVVQWLVLGQAFSFSEHLFVPLWVGTLTGSFFLQHRSLRRKQFIYEALRELSDADEMDVTLGRVAREADALIRNIVDQELDVEAKYPARFKEEILGKDTRSA